MSQLLLVFNHNIKLGVHAAELETSRSGPPRSWGHGALLLLVTLGTAGQVLDILAQG